VAGVSKYTSSPHVFAMPGAVFDVAFTRDGSRIAAVSNDGTIRLWSLATGFESRLLPPQVGVDQQLRVSPDGRWLASSDASSGVVRLWDLVRGRPGPIWNNGIRNAAGLCFSNDGRRIALADTTGAVHLWRIEDRTSRTVSFPDHRVATVVAHPGGTVCMLESQSQTMSLHDLETGETVPLQGASSQTYAACSADGRWLATIGSNGSVHLWDPETGLPAWRTVALLRSPFEVLTHRGWVSLEGPVTRDPGSFAAQRGVSRSFGDPDTSRFWPRTVRRSRCQLSRSSWRRGRESESSTTAEIAPRFFRHRPV